MAFPFGRLANMIHRSERAFLAGPACGNNGHLRDVTNNRHMWQCSWTNVHPTPPFLQPSHNSKQHMTTIDQITKHWLDKAAQKLIFSICLEKVCELASSFHLDKEPCRVFAESKTGSCQSPGDLLPRDLLPPVLQQYVGVRWPSEDLTIMGSQTLMYISKYLDHYLHSCGKRLGQT